MQPTNDDDDDDMCRSPMVRWALTLIFLISEM